MPITTLMPIPKQQYFGITGVPLVGGKVYTYAAGTTDPRVTYTDAAGTVPHQNPITLNARGEPPSPIFWSGNYRVDVRDALGNLVYTVDNYNTDPAGLWDVFTRMIASTGASLIGFLQAGVGAVKRTILDKLRESVSVKDFGADGVDASVNDTAAFLAALATGKNVRVPDGSYLISGSLVFNGAACNGQRLIGSGTDRTRIKYTGNDYLIKLNSDDSVANIVRRAGVSGMTIQGSPAGLGALRVQNSSESRFEDLYIYDFSNAAAKVIYSDSAQDAAWGATYRNVTVQYCPGTTASWWLNNYTWTHLDHCYSSNGGTYAMVIGSGVSMTITNPAIESHTYGIVLTTGLSAAPIESVMITQPHLENLKFSIDINNAIAPGNEYAYGVKIVAPFIASANVAGTIPITIGKARKCSVTGGFTYAPDDAAAMIQVLAAAQDCEVGQMYTGSPASARPFLNDLGTRTLATQDRTTYTPVWSAASGTQPAIGNGTLSADYRRDGNLCTANVTFIVGTTSTFGVTGGVWKFTLPFKANPANKSMGSGTLRQASTGKMYTVAVWASNGENFVSLAAGSGTFPLDFQNPIVWAAGDRIDFSITYPVLSV